MLSGLCSAEQDKLFSELDGEDKILKTQQGRHPEFIFCIRMAKNKFVIEEFNWENSN